MLRPKNAEIRKADGLSLRGMLAYAAPGFILSILGVPLFIYAPKLYTDSYGAPPALIGVFILAARILDGVTDPLVGVVSDRTSTRLGRRRPYLFLASPILGMLLWAIYAPPNLNPQGYAIWFGVVMLLLSVFWTLVDVPWESLGPELVGDYSRRNTLFALRDGLQVVGLLVAVSAPPAIRLVLGQAGAGPDEQEVFRAFAYLFAPLVPLLAWLCALSFQERATSSPVRIPRLADMAVAWGNRPFRILTASYVVAAIGSNLPATLILYYVQYVLKDPNAEQYLVLYFITGIAFLPIWVRLANRLDKKQAWMWAMGVNAGAFSGVFFLGSGDSLAYAVLVALSGVGFGASLALPASMQADVIDLDEHLYGQRREGIFIGVWSVVKKLSSALGLGLALPLLDMAGYVPGKDQPEQVVLLLRVLYAGIPSLCALAAIAILVPYDLDKKAHARLALPKPRP